VIVRVVGYVREAPDPREGEPAFAQTERIRRWAGDGGHHLVAVCQDVRTARDSDRREGLRAVLGIIAEGAAVAVVVPDLATLSADKIVQEIMIRDLRARGATVISAAEEDLPELEDPTSDRLRTLVRHVLLRLEEHDARFADAAPGAGEADEPDHGDVIVELISPEPPEPVERIRPVR
jgi:DNA invertase Pin-like site-specific DNA recombinase